MLIQTSLTMQKNMYDKAKKYCKENSYTFSGFIQSLLRDKFKEEGL